MLGGWLAIGVDVRGKGHSLAGLGHSDGLAKGYPFSNIEGAFDFLLVFFVCQSIGLVDHYLRVYAF